MPNRFSWQLTLTALAVSDLQFCGRRVMDEVAAKSWGLISSALPDDLPLELRKREQDMQRQTPMELLVLKSCVTDTKLTWRFSKSDNKRVKSSRDRLNRSTL